MSAALKDAVDNVSSDGRASTEDGRITQLLTKLLAHLAGLATAFALALTTLRNRHWGHVCVVGVLLLRWSLRIAVHGLLWWHRSLVLLLDEDVVAREDALLAGSLVAAHPPVRIHVLVHCDAVVLFKRQVSGVAAHVSVEGAGMGDGGAHVAGGNAGRRCLLVGWRRGGLCLVDVEALKGLGWGVCGCGRGGLSGGCWVVGCCGAQRAGEG